MSPELQAAARKLAEGGDEGSLTSKGSKRASRASSASIAASCPSAASLARGASGLRVEVAALAGFDSGSGGSGGASPAAACSGGASPAGPSFTAGQRTSRLAPAGHPARASSLGLGSVAGVWIRLLCSARDQSSVPAADPTHSKSCKNPPITFYPSPFAPPVATASNHPNPPPPVSGGSYTAGGRGGSFTAVVASPHSPFGGRHSVAFPPPRAAPPMDFPVISPGPAAAWAGAAAAPASAAAMGVATPLADSFTYGQQAVAVDCSQQHNLAAIMSAPHAFGGFDRPPAALQDAAHSGLERAGSGSDGQALAAARLHSAPAGAPLVPQLVPYPWVSQEEVRLEARLPHAATPEETARGASSAAPAGGVADGKQQSCYGPAAPPLAPGAGWDRAPEAGGQRARGELWDGALRAAAAQFIGSTHAVPREYANWRQRDSGSRGVPGVLLMSGIPRPLYELTLPFLPHPLPPAGFSPFPYR
jgi:hypothetical protein